MSKSLRTDAGQHRWIWDLRYPEPTSTEHEFPIAAVRHDTPRLPLGPLVLPGDYSVRLTVNGKSYTAPLQVKMDPRVKTSRAGLEQQFNLESKLSALLNDSSSAMMQAESVRAQLAKVKTQDTTLENALKAAREKLAGILNPPASPNGAPANSLKRLNSGVAGLYGMVGQSDSQPTAAQLQAAAILERDLPAAMKQWNDFKQGELGNLNRQLQAAHLPEIQATAQASDDGGGADRD
jgi:hypothetical protein